MRKLLLLLAALFTLPVIYAQPPIVADTLHPDTLHLTEQLLLQQEQQEKVDSLVIQRIQNELKLNADDGKEVQKLQQQLQELQERDSIRQAEQMQRIAVLRRTSKGHPVTLLKDTLFLIYTRLGSFNAEERAGAISAKIDRLYEDDFFSSDSLKLEKGQNAYDIVYNGDMVVMSVSNIDALFFNITPHELAEAYLKKIKKSIAENRQANSLANWLKRLAFVTLVIAGIVAIIFIINRLFRQIFRHLIFRKDVYFKGVSIGSYKLFKPKQHLRFFLRLVTVLKIITVFFALYLSLPILFSIFPQTKNYTYTLLNWIITPAKAVIRGIISYLPNLFTIIVIYLFTNYTVKAVKYVANEISTGNLKIRGFYSDWAQPTFNIVRFLLYAFMLIVIFPYLPGSNSPAFQGVSVFLGILFSLGSSSAIANIVAGLVITYMRPFKVGDRVKIGEISGDVLEKTMLVTRLKTIKNEEITVPNATVLSSHTVNYTSGAEKNGLIVHTAITIGYDVPWPKVHKALTDAASRTNLLLKEPAPFVLQTSLQDFYVEYQINAYTNQPALQARIYSDLHQHIQDCCNEVGIEILSPHYRAMRDGNMTTIPENYLPQDYEIPSFRVRQSS